VKGENVGWGGGVPKKELIQADQSTGWIGGGRHADKSFLGGYNWKWQPKSASDIATCIIVCLVCKNI
jgi:hypothetical protein